MPGTVEDPDADTRGRVNAVQYSKTAGLWIVRKMRVKTKEPTRANKSKGKRQNPTSGNIKMQTA